MDEKEIYERLTVVEQRVKSAHHRLDDIDNLTRSISEMVAEVRYMREDLSDVKSRVEEIESKPVRRYDTVVTALITALCSGALGFLLSTLLGN